MTEILLPKHHKKLFDHIYENVSEEKFILGPHTYYSLKNDPKHLLFHLARYKFVMKMMKPDFRVMEVGCGDAFGTVLVASAVRSVNATDWDIRMVEDNRERMQQFENISFEVYDPTSAPLSGGPYNAAYSMDVIEHVEPNKEDDFVKNIADSLTDNGTLIIGTPNKYAEEWASRRSKIGHINWKTHETLESLLSKYFQNVFMYSMNDEVLHTGFNKMGHYVLAVGSVPKR